MRKKTGNKLHTWEAALLLAVAAALLWGACTLQRQDALGQKVIRLHVIANSDSEADQALKLRVRDRVLVLAEDILRQSGDMEEARQRLAEALPRLQQTAAEEIAAAMGQKGTMSALRRTSAGLYTEADAHTLEEILAAKEQGPAALEALMLPVESVFIPLPLLVVEPWVEQHLYNGCPTSRYPAADGRYRVRNAAGQFLGLANITGGVLRVEKLFVERN